MESLQISHPNGIIKTSIKLPASKSLSNRFLALNALSGFQTQIDNLSEARDTELFQNLVTSSNKEIDVKDAGTTMRFLTAYFTVTGQNKLVTGTERMKQRPIKILVEALKELGFEIEYVGKEGFPPVLIKGGQQSQNEIRVKGNISSQYISALLMIGPFLPLGLKITLVDEVTSRFYIEMTIGLMQKFGLQVSWQGDSIEIQPQKPFPPKQITVESDWSAASYWYLIAGLSKEAEIELIDLDAVSLQGDSKIAEIADKFGVATDFHEKGLTLRKKTSNFPKQVDFSNIPDLAQTFAVWSAANGKELTFNGIQSLRIKETDRVQALKNELKKLGAELSEKGDKTFNVSGKAQIKDQQIETYEDHRMAMAFAPLGLINPITIKDPVVTKKSYPGFWDDLKKAGFIIKSV